jgi:cell division septation protein DedD
VGVAVLAIVFSALGQSRQVIYLVSLRNIENQRYPNGSEFSPRDLLVPEVLTEIRRLYDIPADIDLNDAISVAYDSPIASGIAKSYQDRLSARNLSQAEIQALNQSYLEELRTSMRSALRITVDYPLLGLDSERGLALAADVSRLWSLVYTTKYRIFTDRGLADLAVTRTEENLETTASILIANNRVAAMVEGVNKFLEDNRLSMLRVANGVSPADLLIELRNFQAIYFNVLKARAFQSGDTAAQAFMNRLRLDIAEKNRQIEASDAALKGLGDYQRSGRSEQVSQSPVMQTEQASTIQIGDSA